ncbi:amidase domain-containing protein [Nocardia arthritidis]|uniref:Amidase n=1 Tax=Nocardia arthritidis TaxID=228602 RepID=A0A6G9YGT4_9NOCA|nr:amidase domain-containing protein [Nocardia arthritidis]QIS12422.1 amidase [Nocardia arthritidis]
MVTFSQLRNAKPWSWIAAADDMLAAAKQCERIKDDIHDNGVKPLDEHWRSNLGTAAKDTLIRIADQAEVASILARATVDPLDTLGRAVEIAQRELEDGVQVALNAGLNVDEATGTISIPSWVHHDEPEEQVRTGRALRDAQQMIKDALEAADQADRLCAQSIDDASKLDPSTTTDQNLEDMIGKAQKIQADDAKRALEEIRDTIPDGLPPNLVEQWWNSLTPQQQSELKLATPIELYDLPGIPDSVKKEIDRPENGYSTIGALKYAREHANDTSIDWEDKDNCTNFASMVLAYGGGMHQKEDFWPPRHWDRDGWSDGTNGHPDILPPGWSHTPSWGAADLNRKFFLDHGGQVVASSDHRAGLAGAQPGDLMYYTMTEDAGGKLHAGQTHHTVVVTSVLPDGNVLYTQHSGNAENYPFDGRLPEFEEGDGRQKVEVVRPKVTW